MRVIGIIAAYNEERVIRTCLEHHIAQGYESRLRVFTHQEIAGWDGKTPQGKAP